MKTATKTELETIVASILACDSPQNYDDAGMVEESVLSEIEADHFECDDEQAIIVGELCEEWFNAEDQDRESDDE